MTRRIRKAHGSVDDTGNRPGTHVRHCLLTGESSRGLGPVSARALVPHSQTPTGGETLPAQIIINVFFRANLRFLPFKSRMTVHRDSLRSPERMTLSPHALASRRPGTRAQSRAVRRHPEWQILAWRPGFLSPPAFHSVNLGTLPSRVSSSQDGDILFSSKTNLRGHFICSHARPLREGHRDPSGITRLSGKFTWQQSMLNCFCLTRPKMPKYISRFITRINVIRRTKHLRKATECRAAVTNAAGMWH